MLAFRDVVLCLLIPCFSAADGRPLVLLEETALVMSSRTILVADLVDGPIGHRL